MPQQALRRVGLTLPYFVRSTGGPNPRSRTQRAFAAILAWQDRARERWVLRSLDARQLRDVGLTRADVLAELDKPVWRRR